MALRDDHPPLFATEVLRMRSFDPLSLRLFVAVCEERNIATAAAREAIAPSAVSKRIAAIEEQTGATLLERGRRGVLVTPAGETLLRYARELLALMDRMQAELGEFAHGVQGHVRVFASMSALAQFLPEDIARFAERYERVRVSVEEKEVWEVVRGVEEGRADIGVCWDAVDLRRLHSVPYRRDRLAMVVHPGHPLAARKQVAFEDTIDFEHVEISGRSILKATQQQHAAAAGKRMRYRLQVSTVDAACRIVAARLAIAIVPVEEARGMREALGLHVVPLSNAWAKRRFVVSVRDPQALGVPTRLLLDSLRGSALALSPTAAVRSTPSRRRRPAG
jgi:DNA-binding transcriptional LysR family regulator